MGFLYIILIALSLLTNANCQCHRNQTIINEGGTNSCCYYDSTNTPTIGIGFNLMSFQLKNTLAKYGYNTDSILSTCADNIKPPNHCLTNDDVEEIFDEQYDYAEICVESWLGGYWVPEEIIPALVDIAFDINGCVGMKQFKELRKGLLAGDYEMAAKGLEDSSYCERTVENGIRCALNAECIRSGYGRTD